MNKLKVNKDRRPLIFQFYDDYLIRVTQNPELKIKLIFIIKNFRKVM